MLPLPSFRRAVVTPATPIQGESCNTKEIRSQYPSGVVWGGKKREEKVLFSVFLGLHYGHFN